MDNNKDLNHVLNVQNSLVALIFIFFFFSIEDIGFYFSSQRVAITMASPDCWYKSVYRLLLFFQIRCSGQQATKNKKIYVKLNKYYNNLILKCCPVVI